MAHLKPLLFAGLLYSPAAHAFGEDLCYPVGGGPIVSCGPLPDACQPVPTSTDACKQAIITEDGNAQSGIYAEGRSTVHVDSVYYIAQALGFSPIDAYWIAAYDGTVDTGEFSPYDNNSTIYGNGQYATADLTGIERGDLNSGGILLHFIAPYNHGLQQPPPNVNGLTPNPQDTATEPTLANWRAWAMTGSVACTAGLTVQTADGNYGTGPACFASGTPIRGTISALGNAAVPFATATGLQIIEDPDHGAQVLSSHFAAVIATDGAHTTSATHLADARLGVYLHILADRITHHECTDLGVIAGPTAAGFNIDLSNDECVQGWHLLHHAWETGVDFSLVPPNDRTTQAALESTYDELAKFGAARGLTPVAGIDKTALLGALATAIEKFDAIPRVLALDAVGCSHSFAIFPGQPACSTLGELARGAGDRGPDRDEVRHRRRGRELGRGAQGQVVLGQAGVDL
jgi:hypothetical protein